jgi:hypothetical protein
MGWRYWLIFITRLKLQLVLFLVSALREGIKHGFHTYEAQGTFLAWKSMNL